MDETVVSVSWKGYTSELATVYKNLLDDNFLVDCTIFAEGQALKAHRLVLSACSSYFHMLFHEEPAKHPFIVLVDVTFDTLKAVIDFMYQGETQIPEGNFQAFLTLAQSLQIKSLSALTQDYVSRNESSNAIGNVCGGLSEDNQDTSEVPDISTRHEVFPENSHHSDGVQDAVHSNTHVPFEGFRVSCEEVESASVKTSTQEQRTSLACEVSDGSEITIKHEPLFDNEGIILKARNTKLDDVESCISTSENFMSEANGKTAILLVERNLKQYSSCNESYGNARSSVTPPSQLLKQLSIRVPLTQDTAQEPLLPVILVPKNEFADDAEKEESVVGCDVQGNNRNGKDKTTELTQDERSLDHISSCSDSSRGNAISSVMSSSQQGKLSDKLPSAIDVTKQTLLPEILTLENVHMDYSRNEDPMEDHDVPENDTKETVEGTEPACGEQILDKSFNCKSFVFIDSSMGRQLHGAVQRQGARGAAQKTPVLVPSPRNSAQASLSGAPQGAKAQALR
ncbi:Zinc finger protein chinmo [Gryllus bimaculatus]|nr:Zinc finger protein chinmo [Gryllus bimaculatus]